MRSIVLNGEAVEKLKGILEKRDLKLYWGTGMSGSPTPELSISLIWLECIK
jgi:hypothetical protein